jgi:O-antigen biosynthesis protein WbqP
MAHFLLCVFAIPILFIAVLIRLTSTGPVLYWSDRVGKDNVIFKMPKFRTMKVNTPPVATHLLTNPEHYFTPVGKLLRKLSLDELPQIFSILKGDMSFVGPRPALFNQDDLIQLRTNKNIQTITPGLTGWAQVNGRDDLPIPTKVELDEHYFRHQSFRLDMKILLMTMINVISSKGVQH